MIKRITAFFILIVLTSGLYAQNNDLDLKHTTSFVVFPQDTNANFPMAFGGKLLSEMDRCAGITTRRFLYKSPNKVYDAVTVAVNDVKFHKSAQVKDLLFVTGNIINVTEKSITVKVSVEREILDKRELIVDGNFIFVSYDVVNKKSVGHGIFVK